MIDVHFPIITYQADDSPLQRGRFHGESYRDAIGELISIRTELMREKNRQLTDATIENLAGQQWAATVAFAPALADELLGISQGAQRPLHELIVLNNYTDFRDLQVLDQGCSAIYVHRSNNRIAGQTWDMHRSAKRFVCCIEIPSDDTRRKQIVFSVVGCVGMMGFSACGGMVGVNNLNTLGAEPGVIWPVMIRSLLDHADRRDQQRRLLQQTLLTSGRSFLLASSAGAEFWEVMPGLQEQVGKLDGDQTGGLFHTNHCLGTRAKERENSAALSSTTRARYDLIERKIDSVVDLDSGWRLLNDHEGYPLSICSNYQTNSQDPSVTCGGAVGDLTSGQLRFWRGDQLHDDHFVEHRFQIEN